LPAPRKRPRERTGTGSGRGDDPRFIKVAQGQSQGAEHPIPQADSTWRPKARSWYNSLKLSGQSEFFEPSDWATAVAAADAYDVFLRTHNASILAQFTRLSERLGATITDRQRNRIQLEEPAPEDEDEAAADTAVQGWQGRLHSVELGPMGEVPCTPV
jgi:hypothetical protein